MNFLTFSTETTNVFPMANSAAGGQLLTEFNLRSRESVETDPNVQYMIGPSYTHSMNDFYISKQVDSLGDEISNQVIQISEGRAVVNGHYVETLAPMVIDIASANALINKQNRGNNSKKQSKLTGSLKIGLRTMYSTVPTMTGALMIEDKYNMYEGLQVVILPESEFILPSDAPEDPNKVTAHLLLGTFKYVNGAIVELRQNEAKIQSIDGARIGNVSNYLSGQFITKTGLNPKHHYVYSTKADAEHKDISTWCEADDSLMVWDSNPQLLDESDPNLSVSQEAKFRYNPVYRTTELVMPHKQIDEMKSTSGELQYYNDKVLTLPTASYLKGTGGVVDKNYTDNIKNIAAQVSRFYQLPNGGMKAYIDVLSDRSELPVLKNQNWNVGDYIVVGSDETVDSTGADYGFPSTLYMVIPGIVKTVDFKEDYTFIPIDFNDTLSWQEITSRLLTAVDWDSVIAAESPKSPDWNNVVYDAINALDLIQGINWNQIIKYAVDSQPANSDKWANIIKKSWDNAWEKYTSKRTAALTEAEEKVAYYQGLLEGAESDAQSKLEGMNTAEGAAADANSAVSAAAANVADANRALTRATEVASTCQTNYDEYRRNTYEPATQDIEDARGAYRTAVANWENKKGTSEEAAAKKDMDDAKARLDSAEQSYSSIQSQMNTLSDQLAAANAAVSSAESNKSTAQSKYASAQATAVTAESAYNSARRAYTTAKNNLDTTTNALIAWQAKAADARYSVYMVSSMFTDDGSLFPVGDWVKTITDSMPSGDIESQDWDKIIYNQIAGTISNDTDREGDIEIGWSSEVDWNKVINDALASKENPASEVDWNSIVTNAVARQAQARLGEDWYNFYKRSIPDDLKGGYEIGSVESDQNPRNMPIEEVYKLVGITTPDDPAAPRGRTGIDYFRIIYNFTETDPETQETTDKTMYSFWTVGLTTQNEYSIPPISLTGTIPLAEEDRVGGFFNVPDTQLGAGYVYRDDSGYLRLLDYDLLATGVLAYQLGENYTSPAGLSSDEIQANLEEYVNNRVAFPNSNQKVAVEELRKSGQTGAYVDPNVIHIYVDLSEEDSGYDIKIENIDSRFSSSVFVHLTGLASSINSVYISNIEKLRLEIAPECGAKVYVSNCELYYDPDVFDRINHKDSISIWYRRYTDSDPDLIVEDMTVQIAGVPTRVTNEDYWTPNSPNDNHYSYGLKAVTLSHSGEIIGIKLLITDDITANVEEGTYISSFEFKLPQSLGLSYPETGLTKQIKVTGEFITAYAINNPEGYCLKENSFTALSYPYSSEKSLAGVLSIKTTTSYVTNVYGFDTPTALDGWESGKFHIFEGGTID